MRIDCSTSVTVMFKAVNQETLSVDACILNTPEPVLLNLMSLTSINFPRLVVPRTL